MLDLTEPDPAELHGIADGTDLTALQRRTAEHQMELAATFRAVAAVSLQAAVLLETGGSIQDFAGFLAAYQRLQAQGGDQVEVFGALLSSAGAA